MKRKLNTYIEPLKDLLKIAASNISGDKALYINEAIQNLEKWSLQLENLCDYNADFLSGNEDGSVEQAGFEFANCFDDKSEKEWWNEILKRIRLRKEKYYGIF
jgi:hypothetical protein